MSKDLLNGIRNRIALVGIELEGGWNRDPGVSIIRDGSVEFHRSGVRPPTLGEAVRTLGLGEAARTVRRPDGTIMLVSGGATVVPPRAAAAVASAPYPTAIGEVVSPKPPQALTVHNYDVWMRKVYPQMVNETCGLHVHVSFTHKLNYSRLITPDLTPFAVERLSQWGRAEGLPADHMFWARLNPNHPWTQQHCAHLFLGDNQVKVTKKEYNSRGTPRSRYTFINYCEAQHHTVEYRGLPMFGRPEGVTVEDIEQAIRAVGAVLNATNSFLSKIRQRERAETIAVVARPPIMQEFGAVIR